MRKFVPVVILLASIGVARADTLQDMQRFEQNRAWQDNADQFYRDTHQFEIPAYRPPVQCRSYWLGGTLWTDCD
jgi:hypothetical protein